MTDSGWLLVSAMCVFGLSGVCPGWSDETGTRAVRRSDVVFMGVKSEDEYRRYGGTIVSWGGRPWGDNVKAVTRFREQVELSHALGMKHCGGAAFRTAFAGMIDFDPDFMDSVCRDLDGKPILVPWLWDHKHKGHPAYWFCTNAPGYRKYLRNQIRLLCQANIDGLHIDDYNGTAGAEWQGGCFCRHCMAAFREYLRENVSVTRLKECGVGSLADFHYGRFLRDRGITKDEYRRKVGGSIPLGPEYLRFQYQRSADWVAGCRKYAEGLVGHRLLLSVNSSATDYKSLVIGGVLDYFCGEVRHGADRGGVPSLDPVWSFKLADAVGKPQVATASGRDWAYIAAHHKPGLVRLWVAQDYAFGHQLMAPVRQWAYTKEKGTHWYQSEPGDYAYLYRFVRRHAELFDGYESAATVALLYSNPAFRAGRRGARSAALTLAENNVPFRLVVAGDDWLPMRLTPAVLARYAVLVLVEPTWLTGSQKEAVDAARSRGNVITWDPKNEPASRMALRARVPPQVGVSTGNLLVVPRVKADHPEAPAVVHLLNRDYDPATDTVRPQTHVTVELESSLFGGRRFTSAEFVSVPERATADNEAAEPVRLKVTVRGEKMSIGVPKLGLWGLLKLDS